MKRIILLLLVCFLITNCNVHKATITELASKKTSYQMSYDAMRRGTIVTIDNEGNVKKILAEVQPDAAIALTTDLTTNLVAKLKTDDSLSANQIIKITESLSTLGKRTAAVNILRDALYRLEEHCINFPENCKEQYWGRFDSIVKQIVNLEIQNTIQSKNEKEKAAEETNKVKAEITLKILDTDLDAKTNYQLAIKTLLDKDKDNSLSLFKSLYEKYPRHFNIDEINKKLIELSKNGMDNTKWKALYKYILEGRTWQIDQNLLKQLKEQSK